MNIYPKEQQGSALALWSIAVMAGPVLGPVLGGWLTSYYSWRYAFFVNLPIGIGYFFSVMSAFMTRTSGNQPPSWTGSVSATLGVAIAALQILLDRGQEPRLVSVRTRSSSRHCRRPRRLLPVPRPYLHGAEAVHQAIAVSGFQLRRRLAFRRGRRPDRTLRRWRCSLPTCILGELPDPERGSGGRESRWSGHHGRVPGRRTAGRAGRHALAAGRRHRAHGLVFLSTTGWTRTSRGR